jgi:hypothetical protein
MKSMSLAETYHSVQSVKKLRCFTSVSIVSNGLFIGSEQKKHHQKCSSVRLFLLGIRICLTILNSLSTCGSLDGRLVFFRTNFTDATGRSIELTFMYHIDLIVMQLKRKQYCTGN